MGGGGWEAAMRAGKMREKIAQSCPTLCDPMDYTVHGIFQARILEWIAFPFSRGSSQPRDRTQRVLLMFQAGKRSYVPESLEFQISVGEEVIKSVSKMFES